MRELGSEELLTQESAMDWGTKPDLSCMPRLGLETRLLGKLAGAGTGVMHPDVNNKRV